MLTNAFDFDDSENNTDMSQKFVPDENMFKDKDVPQNPFGFEQDNGKPSKTPKDKKEKKSKKLKMGIIVTVFVFIIAAVALMPFVFLKMGDSSVADGDFKAAKKYYSWTFGLYGSKKRAQAVDSALKVENGETDDGIIQALDNGIEVHINYDLNGGHFIGSGRSESVTVKDKSEFTNFYIATKDNCDFKGWHLEQLSYSPENNDSSMEFYLKADFVPTIYSISYTGLLNTDNSSNPTEYTSETSTFTLTNPTRLGYTFISWTGNAIDGESRNVTIPQGSSGDLAFVANWQPNVYTVTFNPDIECDIPSSIKVTFDDAYEFPEIEKRGYTYKGWSDGKEEYTNGLWSVTDNVSVKPIWELNTYTLSYDLAGGTLSSPNATSYTVLDDAIKINNPSRFGYTFLGWSYDGYNGYNKNVTIPANSVGDFNFKANWTGNRHTLTLNLAGGTASSKSVSVVYDDPYKIPTPTRTGYSFDGWYEGSNKYTDGIWKQDKDVTVSAKWTANTYKITFDSNGGPSVSPKSFTYDKDAKLDSLTRTGYTFLGWYNGSTKVESGTWKQVGNITLKASWKPNTYTVSLNPNGGDVSSKSVTVTYDSKFSLPAPYKIGHDFLGWYNGSSSQSSTGTWKSTSNMSLEAKWAACNYKITFDSNGGPSVSSKTYTYGHSYDLPVPTRVGYNFLGWYKSGEKYTSGTWNIPGDTTFVARWDAIEYTISFDDNGADSSVKDVVLLYDQSYALPVPKKKGHTFLGWYDGYTKYSNTGTWRGSSDLTLTAKWEVRSFSVKLLPDGGNLNKTQYYFDYGERYELPTPEKRGYTFAGWYMDGKKYSNTGTFNFDEDLVLGALWLGEKYTVTLDTNGGDEGTMYYVATYGSSYKLPTPTRAGYVFDGWYYGYSSFNPSGSKWTYEEDITLKASWTARDYIVRLNADGGTVSKAYFTFGYGDWYELPIPVKSGYDFGGWYNSGKRYPNSGRFTYDKDLNLTAMWMKQKHTIYLDPDGGTVASSSIKVEYGSSYSLPRPVREGYSFTGWFDSRGTLYNPTGRYNYDYDLSLTAGWKELN